MIDVRAAILVCVLGCPFYSFPFCLLSLRDLRDLREEEKSIQQEHTDPPSLS
jgi:hypothetical protein